MVLIYFEILYIRGETRARMCVYVCGGGGGMCARACKRMCVCVCMRDKERERETERLRERHTHTGIYLCSDTYTNTDTYIAR